MSCVPRKTERDTELCGQEVSWGALSGSTPAGNEESRTRERRKLNCDAAITWAALEPARPLRIVLNGGKGARALCPRIDQSLDAGCHLGLVHGLGHGGSLQLQVIFCEGPSCVLSITNRLRAPTLKGGVWCRAGQCPTASFQQVTSLLCAPVFSSVRFQLQGSDSIKPPSLLLLTPPFLLGYTQFNIPPLLQCLQHLLLGCDKVQMPWVTFKALRNLVPTYPFSLPPH